ncbi:MBL fold hydrolase [Desulfosarcina ovata subsp. sediminis]|uniref:MBL fold hydrolase n=1 Tax=Desulfosarcina ovata subsp. sediminis TaxID=885957 RepID=A0A5K7ZXD6_9BACT|nr:MBL fold metallo-hydrolase [Desulfosarcina ovata]BBO84927.1 MBL fold hydrolase [Desulfosarcina ovata subsp. sediminis]
MNKEVRISILCDDQAQMGFRDNIFLAQHGFSVFVAAEQNILFDTGATDVFMHNAGLFGIDVNTADWIVLSHGHWDHADGLRALDDNTATKMKVLVHPGAFVDRHKATGQYNGMFYRREEMAQKFDLVLSKGPYRITDRICFLGEIPRLNDFEAQQTAFFHLQGEDRRPDFIIDDTALTIETKKGLIIITGCSHAGICNIVDYAKKVTGQKNIHAVIGGFHLLGDRHQIEKTIDYFQRHPVAHLYPMHCTNLEALCAFYRVFGIQKLCAGDTIAFEM